MKMSPIFSSTGQILGHIDVNLCIDSPEFLILKEKTSAVLGPIVAEPLLNFTNIFKIPKRDIHFRCNLPGGVYDEQKVNYLVLSVDPPNWFWDAEATVKFLSDDWNRKYF